MSYLDIASIILLNNAKKPIVIKHKNAKLIVNLIIGFLVMKFRNTLSNKKQIRPIKKRGMPI